MKKNGFTLVELLAVIAILAILVIVAMPNVIDMFNQAKQNTFVTEVQKYMDNAKAQFTSDAFSNAGKTIYYSSEDNTSLSTSKLDIDGNKEYFIEMDRHGKFKRIVIYDANFCYDIYSPGGKGDITGTKSKKIDDDITKSTIGASDVWLSGSDSVSAIINGDNYVVSGCNGEAKAIVNQDSEFEVEPEPTPTPEPEPEPVTLITFYILGNRYHAEENMTFGEWISSEYNTGYDLDGGSSCNVMIENPSSPYVTCCVGCISLYYMDATGMHSLTPDVIITEGFYASIPV